MVLFVDAVQDVFFSLDLDLDPEKKKARRQVYEWFKTKNHTRKRWSKVYTPKKNDL